MENYTNPEQEGQQDPQDLLNASLIFARALGFVFREDEGIVVDIKGDIFLGEGINKVIVFKQNNQIHIFKCEEDIEEGSVVNLGPTPEGETQSPETEQ
jgi:hypothetical protein